ncbi:HTH DNA binding protein [Mycobacterium phage Yoshi]|uniref:Helix-turn-helix DNA binding domain protein n=2 Tax=Gracegardnervirinae TaxID=2946632 RepID=G1BSF7_9CAUD|nr:HTH DNA binding protein [Mycobacterium phage Yoshi]YP_009848860.1 HTH DNA binding protein [Mycobacterium phage ThetaBob]AEK07801.1 hypothetical protein YOSHI_50 [Mycobacterium phage Yoshi]QDF19928.1 hypothetical protein SEA_THETABOB_41 [Mycobacterium phage ThetaBob]
MKRGETPEPQRSKLLAAVEAHDVTRSELLAAVREASSAGGSVREIAALTGKSTNTIQRWLKEQ